MDVHLKIIGILLVLLALIHIGFPRYFNWEKELKGLSLINKEMFKVHTFFIALFVFLLGILCMICDKELVSTDLGRKICFGIGLFWFIRLIFQIFVYSPKLWIGKRFETAVHILFTAFWIYLCWVFWEISFC